MEIKKIITIIILILILIQLVSLYLSWNKYWKKFQEAENNKNRIDTLVNFIKDNFIRTLAVILTILIEFFLTLYKKL